MRDPNFRNYLPELSDVFPQSWVLVHSMGKVGSYSVYKSIQSLKRFRVLHTHELDLKHIRKMYGDGKLPGHAKNSIRFLNEFRDKDTAKVIINIREPMSRNVSAFFENLSHFNVSSVSGQNIDELIDIFLSHYPQWTPLNWFRREILKPLGIDVLALATSESRVFSYNRLQVLVLRTEDDDEETNQRVRKFLGAEDFKLMRMNVGEEKPYANLYSEFKAAFSPSSDLLDWIFSADYFRLFYTVEEQAQIRADWESDRRHPHRPIHHSQYRRSRLQSPTHRAGHLNRHLKTHDDLRARGQQNPTPHRYPCQHRVDRYLKDFRHYRSIHHDHRRYLHCFRRHQNLYPQSQSGHWASHRRCCRSHPGLYRLSQSDHWADRQHCHPRHHRQNLDRADHLMMMTALKMSRIPFL